MLDFRSGPSRCSADFEHFSAGDSFGDGKSEFVTNARRNGMEYITPESAGPQIQNRRPEGKVRPITDHDQTRQNGK